MLEVNEVNPLELLPVRVIKAKAYNSTDYVDVLVDGDYDGEYFAGLHWGTNPGGYIRRKTGDNKSSPMYLHHMVLPPKPGYWVTHLNGDKLDNRSANLAYMTPKEVTDRRENAAYQVHITKFRQKMKGVVNVN